MSSFEQIRSESVGGSRENIALEPEKALDQEKGVFEQFRGKAKKAAGVMMLMTALSAAPEWVQETYGQEEKNPEKAGYLATERIEKRKPAKEFTFKEFKAGAKENGHDVKIEFLDNEVETTLKEQNIQFNEKEGSFTLLNEGKKEFDPKEMMPVIKEALTLKFEENNEVRTEKVEVSTEKIIFVIPGKGVNSTTRKIIKIKSYNSDGSADIFTISEGKVAGVITEKPQK
jgi:hypothetical protein